jgi:nitroimidazol reductase NimA-like FMN-containing flavoprotein (pyridoxamine 5'-phosphate oxidase superfamily)
MTNIIKPTEPNDKLRLEVGTIYGPARWASYFVNGESSGLDDQEEKAEANAFLDELMQEGWYVVSCEGEPFFDGYQAAIEYVLHRHVKGEG